MCWTFVGQNRVERKGKAKGSMFSIILGGGSRWKSGSIPLELCKLGHITSFPTLVLLCVEWHNRGTARVK